MIAADVGAIGYGAGQGLQVLPVICDTVRIVNYAAGAGNYAAGAGNYTAGAGTVVVGTATLGNLDLRTIEVAGDAGDHVIHGLRPALPADVGFRALLTAGPLHRE